MAWFYCDRIGTGTDQDPFRPAVHDYDIPWSATVEFEQRGKYLVSCEEQPGFAADSRIVPMSKSVFTDEIPDDGEDDGQDSEALALKVVRRAKLENLLGTDDVWDALGPSLVSSLNPGARGRAIAKMAQAGINPGEIIASTKVDDVLRNVLPQIPARVAKRAVGNSGSFTDNFNGEGSNVDLASHTPSGGTAWARQDGSANDIIVTTGGITQTSGSGVYWCDDQGSADQYTQGVIQATAIGAFLIIRSSDANNFWGVRSRSNGQSYKRVGGSFSLVGTGSGTAVGNVLRIEGSGNDIETFIDTGSGFVSFTGPHNDSFNNTATRQGLGGSSFGTGSFTDDFEAGVLSAGGSDTIVAGQGSYTYTGYAANLVRDHIMVAESGSYTYTGQAAGVAKGYNITAEQGSYAYAGQAASLLWDRILSAGQGSYTYTGQAATTSAGGSTISFVGGNSASSTNGSNVSIDLSGLGLQEDDWVYVAGASYELGNAGNVAVLTSGYTQIASQDFGGLGGTPFAVERKKMGATPDTSVSCQGGGSSGVATVYIAMAFRNVNTGTPEDVTATTASGGSSPGDPDPPSSGTPVTSDCAALVFGANGANTTFTVPSGYSDLTQIAANAAIVDFTIGGAWRQLSGGSAEDPGIFDAASGAAWASATILLRPASAFAGVIAEAGLYVLTGQNAGTAWDRTLTAGQGSYSYTGQDASVFKGYVLLANQGSYSVAGQGAGTAWGHYLAAAQGDYALTGYDVVTTAGNKIMAAGQGSYSYTGQAATTRRGYVMATIRGSYTITGYSADFEAPIWQTLPQAPGETWTDANAGSDENWTSITPGPGETWQ